MEVTLRLVETQSRSFSTFVRQSALGFRSKAHGEDDGQTHLLRAVRLILLDRLNF